MPQFTTLTWEPSARWVRGTKSGTTVVDSKHPVLVRDPDKYVPLYAFPKRDVRVELLRPSARPPGGEPDAGGKEFFDLVVDGVTVENAAWAYPPGELADYIAFEWFLRDGVIDHWYEEDEEIFVTPRDPAHRVDALRSSRHVEVWIDGKLVADSRQSVALFETGHAVRYYVPQEDIRMELFEPTDSRTGCPYKGFASYWSYTGGDTPVTRPDVAWGYPDPTPESGPIKGHLAFYDNVAEYVVDGEKI
ncbi:DUF427 domain-containing protein [Streptomyces beijiangensis]|uniref:DUF427 domain-containing protein n=1 Tax=Streptomyces beijiangensis TaxID=163361 RepID=A0A939F9D7_9ACTN|nr:DUF427 domain-containing protein [Streptomyces beijiangensis]MBO0514151.1 DUF427 domain-containing protein [Streptomyces beijiangensis]